MRVLVLGDNTSFHTYRWFEAYKSADFEVRALGFEDGESLCERLSPNGKGKLKYFLSIPKLKEVIREFKPDIIHAQMAGNYGLMAYLTGKPYILSLWGPDVVESPFKSVFHKTLIKKVIRNALLVHADSQLVRWFLEKGFGVDAEKIVVFPFGISSKFFEYEIEKPVGKINLISHRKLERLYGHDVILKAAKLLKERGVGFKLYIASFGSEEEKLKRLALKLGIANMVVFTGRLDEEDLISFLSKSHIFISSAYSDTTPNSLLEAMALKVYPVLSDLPVYREWVIDGLNGSYFRPGDEFDLADKLEHIIKNLSKLDIFLSINRLIVENLANWDKNFESFRNRLLIEFKKGAIK
ncbi:MAG: glycosyltransferase family 4 protein [bacterium]|nr:glycosyltransferase family 4 protein [bacterium]